MIPIDDYDLCPSFSVVHGDVIVTASYVDFQNSNMIQSAGVCMEYVFIIYVHH